MARTTLLLLSILFLLPTNAAIKKLQVEYLTNPIGLDITACLLYTSPSPRD